MHIEREKNAWKNERMVARLGDALYQTKDGLKVTLYQKVASVHSYTSLSGSLIMAK
jgi:hypothetical protein